MLAGSYGKSMFSFVFFSLDSPIFLLLGGMISLMMTLDSSKEQIYYISKVLRKVNLIFPSTYFSVLKAAINISN